MATLNRLTEFPSARVVVFPEADESPGPAAAPGRDPAGSRRPAPARCGADRGRPVTVAVLETSVTGARRRAAKLYGARLASVRHAPARRLFGAPYARIRRRARRSGRPVPYRMTRRIGVDRPHNFRQA